MIIKEIYSKIDILLILKCLRTSCTIPSIAPSFNQYVGPPSPVASLLCPGQPRSLLTSPGIAAFTCIPLTFMGPRPPPHPPAPAPWWSSPLASIMSTPSTQPQPPGAGVSRPVSSIKGQQLLHRPQCQAQRPMPCARDGSHHPVMMDKPMGRHGGSFPLVIQDLDNPGASGDNIVFKILDISLIVQAQGQLSRLTSNLRDDPVR